MNLHVKLPEQPKEAKLRYKPMEHETITPGEFVRCAVTGRPIAVADLRYWSVERQEPYATAKIAWEAGQKRQKG